MMDLDMLLLLSQVALLALLVLVIGRIHKLGIYLLLSSRATL